MVYINWKIVFLIEMELFLHNVFVFFKFIENLGAFKSQGSRKPLNLTHWKAYGLKKKLYGTITLSL